VTAAGLCGPQKEKKSESAAYWQEQLVTLMFVSRVSPQLSENKKV
jgi:hypothetical protein